MHTHAMDGAILSRGAVRQKCLAGFLLLLLAMCLAPATAIASTDGTERRVALVVGNSAYQHTPYLVNPVNDAEAMAAALQRLGFDVTKGIDLDRSGTEAVVRKFAEKLPGSDTALFFYAGHGVQVGGENYLIPIDAQLTNETDLHFEATGLNFVLGLMEGESRVNLVFLDACRDNPLSNKLARSLGATRSASVGRGLALVGATDGSFVVYATQPDNVALDGDSLHSPFTAALLNHIETPDLSINDMMIAVRNEVKAATHGKQVPREDSSLSSPFYFRRGIAAVDAAQEPASAAVAGSTGNAPVVDREVVFWQSIQNSNSLLQYQAYLDQYPDGTFARLARARIEEMKIKPIDTGRSGEQVTSLTTPDTTVPTAEEIERGLSLNRAGRSRVQLALTLLGYKTGGTDGSLGPKSRAAIRAWQTDVGDAASGYLTPQQHAKLLDMAKPKLAVWDEAQKAKAAAEAAKSEQQPADSGGAIPAAEQEPQEIVSQEPVPVPIVTDPPEETAPENRIQPVPRKGSNGGSGSGSGGSGNSGGGGWN